MSNPENQKLISWVRTLMILAGFWNQPISNNQIITKMFYVYSVIMRLSCILFWLSLVAELARLIIYQYELSIIVTSLSVVVTDSKIMIKMILYLKNNTLNLLEDIIEKEGEVWASRSEEIKALYRRKIAFLKVAVFIMGTSNFLTIIWLEISGVFTVIQHKEHNAIFNDSIESHVMYQTIFPLDRTNHVYWLLTTQVLWAWVGLIFNLVTQLIFVTILLYAASQLEIMQVRFRNLIEQDFDIMAGEEKVAEKVKELKGLIHDLQYVVTFIKNFNKSTKYITMMEFIFSSLDMATVSVSLMKQQEYKSLWLLFFIVLLFTQLFLIGWTSNEIKSEAIGDALYQSKWYVLNKDGKQIILISIARARIPLMMTIGPFGPMTTNSILLVLKAAYSYINIMMRG
ncbi:hypothetical protein HUJ05_001105 [Dendroctonus ponderosae]|nr:hypothetical protein HUJ05_001105 [Dendroctonus ponderosae]